MSEEDNDRIEPIPTKCSQCSFIFGRFDLVGEHRFWCDHCFVETPPELRFRQATPEDLAETKARQEKTRQSLKQRAIDKKQKKGLTTAAKPTKVNTPAEPIDDLTAADMLIDLGGDAISIFDETGED